MKKDGIWQERAGWGICAALAVLALFLVMKYALGVLLPFLIAWAVAAVVYPVSCRLAGKTGLPQRFWAAVLVLLMLAALGFLTFLAVSRLAEEVQALMVRLRENREAVTAAVERLLSPVERFFALLHRKNSGAAMTLTPLDSMIGSFVNESVSGLGARLSAILGRLITAAPGAVIGCVVTVMSCFYLSMDYGEIGRRLLSFFPPAAGKRLQAVQKRLGGVLRCYAKAYLLLFLLTFVEVLCGLLILRRPYAFLVAFVIATVDILPVLGTGTVLIPWAVILLLSGQYRTGLGLLILYGVVTVVRQIAEPHLIGGTLGIHPLATLFFLFVGVRLFGFAGVLLAPLAALLFRETRRMREEKIFTGPDGR